MPSLAPEEWLNWRVMRLAELSAPDSWLGVCGLFWLSEGNNAVGSSPDAVVRLPEGPATLGYIKLSGHELHWWHPRGPRLTIDGTLIDKSGDSSEISQASLHSDRNGPGSRIDFDHWQLNVIARDGRLGIRVKNRKWSDQRKFSGIESFPYDPFWAKAASWEGLLEPVVIDVPTVTGDIKSVTVTHQARFEHLERSMSLLPMSQSDEGVFFVFRDANCGRLCYGGGRFLHAAPPRGPNILLDFNRAYNPPCAFTMFATCPLPPSQNWLEIPVNAGELRYEQGQ